MGSNQPHFQASCCYIILHSIEDSGRKKKQRALKFVIPENCIVEGMQMNRCADDWNQSKLGGNNLCAAFEVQSTSLRGVDMAHTGCDLVPCCIAFMTCVYIVGGHGLTPNWTENTSHMAPYSLHSALLWTWALWAPQGARVKKQCTIKRIGYHLVVNPCLAHYDIGSRCDAMVMLSYAEEFIDCTAAGRLPLLNTMPHKKLRGNIFRSTENWLDRSCWQGRRPLLNMLSL